MSHIKFRVWGKKEKSYMIEVAIENSSELLFFNISKGKWDEFYDDEDYIVELSTGLKDKEE